MSARSSCRWLPLLLPMRTPMSQWWARRSSTVRLSPVRWGSRQRIRKIVSAVQQFVDKLNSMDWISKRRSCPWYYIGIDWQREKWQSGLGSKFIHQGEKNAAKYADEVIVLSKGVQDYFKETYGRETHFMYAKGMTTRQISETIEDIYGFETSEGFISDVTDKIMPQIEDWKNRPLDEVYPILYMMRRTFWRLLLTCPKSCCIYIARAGSSNLALPARSLS